MTLFRFSAVYTFKSLIFLILKYLQLLVKIPVLKSYYIVDSAITATVTFCCVPRPRLKFCFCLADVDLATYPSSYLTISSSLYSLSRFTISTRMLWHKLKTVSYLDKPIYLLSSRPVNTCLVRIKKIMGNNPCLKVKLLFSISVPVFLTSSEGTFFTLKQIFIEQPIMIFSSTFLNNQ